MTQPNLEFSLADIFLILIFYHKCTYWVIMFHLMFFKVASIKIFFITSFHLTSIMLSLLFFWNVSLWMLFQVCSCCKWFTTFIAYERFLIFVDFFVSVQIRFLIETLSTVLVVARIWLFSGVDYFVPDEPWLQIEFFLTIIVWTNINFRVDIFNFLRILRTPFLSMSTFDESIISTITSDTLVLLWLILNEWILIFIAKTSHFLYVLFLNGTMFRKKMLRFLRFRMTLRMVRFVFRVFAIEAETTFVSKKIHSLEPESL